MKSSVSKKELKTVGIVFSIVLVIISAFLLWKGRTNVAAGVGGLGILALISALFFPASLRPLHKTATAVSLAVGWIMMRFSLVVLFYLVITPIGLIGRWFGKDFLKSGNADGSTGWIKRESEPGRDKKRYEKQY